jgi:hypothetical protein
MKNPLDFAKDILNNKIQEDILPCDSFVPFLIQRYISGVSPVHCNLINSILNSKLPHWSDNQQVYNFLKCLIPKKDIKYIPYIWKKREVIESNFDIATVSENLEMSQKDIQNLVDIFPELEESFKDDNEKILKARK